MRTLKFILTLVVLGFAQSTIATSSGNDHSEGEKLFMEHCNACHGMAGGMNMKQRVAPPIAGVRMHYKAVHPDKESFVNAVTSWLEKQNESKSLMPDAIRHFNIMPTISVPKEDAKKIAAYIYEGNIQTPEGYQKHFEKKHGKHKGGQANNRFATLLIRQLRLSTDQIEALNLSQQQLQKLRTLVVEKEAIMQPLREEVLDFNHRLNTLDTRKSDYKSEIFALADVNAKRVEQMVIESGEMRFKIESVLDSKQYQMLMDARKLMNERYKKMKHSQ